MGNPMTLRLPPEICFLCLSRDRKIFNLSENIRHLFGFLTDWYLQNDALECARVCWECRAMLEKLRRFKEQAKEAVHALERARAGLQPMTFECLSNVHHTQMLFIDLLVNDDANTSNDDFSFVKNYSKIPYKYEMKVEFEEKLKVKSETADEIDLGVDLICGNTPDCVAEDDAGSNCLTITLTEDNTENAIQYEQVILPQTILYAPSTSKEGEIKSNAPSTSKDGEIKSKKKRSSEIKKKQSVIKGVVKCKKRTNRRVRRKLTAAEVMMKKERLEAEQKYRQYQQGKSYECDHCGKKFERRKQILQHMRDHNNSLMCEQCSYKCRCPSSLKEHMLIHLEKSQRPLECEVCHDRFTTKYKLIVHTRRHTGERPFKCDTCDNAFVSKEAMIRHKNNRHVNRDTQTKQKSARPKPKRFYTVASGALGRRRLESCYDKKYNIIKNSENITYECNICKEIFTRVNAFYKHYHSTHRKRIPCTECNHTFIYPSQLALHINTVHRGERPYQCNICGARRVNKSCLQIHMSTHSNEKPFKCDECSATFKYNCGLYTHKMIHKGDKPHQCDICAARFTHKGTLVGHMKVHTKDRPFACDICSKKFPWKRNLKNHLKVHLKE